jgi:hypothetical protein
LPPDDGQPAQVETGLQMAMVSASGQIVNGDGPLPIFLSTSLDGNGLASLDALTYPEGAFFDPESGQLVVFGPPARAGAHPASDDFLVALQSVYNETQLAVSIDPTGDPVTQNVRYEGSTAATHFGWVMFEADRYMKTLSMGQDNLSNLPVGVNVTGYANMLDLELALGEQTQGDVRRRFWFTVPVAEIEQTSDGQGMSISMLSLAVKTEYLDANWQTMAFQPPDPVGRAFASHLTDYFSDYAHEIPVFSELEALARWAALAHWLYQSDLPFQAELLLANSPNLYDTPRTTPAITVTRQSQQGNITHTLTLWGGVDLGMDINVKPAGQATQSYLQGLVEKFKAKFASPRAEVSPIGIAFSSVAPVSLTRDVVTTIQLPTSPSLTLVYSSGVWQIKTPHLTAYGTSESPYFVYDDTVRTPIMLMYDGQDVSTGEDVFTNRDAGYWLSETENGFQLSQGEFLPDGQYSYVPGQVASFNPDGQILYDSLSGVGVEYVYSSGQLTDIQQGQTLVKFRYSGNNLQEIQSAESRIEFEYQNGSLSELLINGESFKKIEYDTQGHLSREFDSLGQAIRQTQYDSHGQTLYQTEHGQGFLYDWLPSGTLALYSGPALVSWQGADTQDLEELKIALRLSQHPKINHLVFARKINEKLVVLADDRSYTLPAYLLQNPERLRRKLENLLGEVVAGETVMISTGDITSVSFQSLFPNAIPLTIETMDEARVLANLEKLDNLDSFTPQTASILNAIPLPEEVEKVGFGMEDAPLWADWKMKIEEMIRSFGFSSPTASAAQVKLDLQTKSSVLVVVAHGDQRKIYFPDGSVFSPESLTDEQKNAIAKQNPFVILLSCNTASITPGEVSLSQRLLDLGSGMVVAPNGNLPMDDASLILERFLENAKTSDPLQAILNAIRSVYPDWLIPSDDGSDHFFKILTDKPFSAQEAT